MGEGATATFKAVDGLRALLLDRAADLAEADWQALDTGGDPFVSRAFLGAAEDTGAAGPDLGWRAMHLALRDGRGDLAGLLPLYLRHHSFGDFSHDWSWAQAWRQSGLDYYPKLVSGVPFTPSPGPRLLERLGQGGDVKVALVKAGLEVAAELGVSAWQCLFVRETDLPYLAEAGLLVRRGVQFHWLNRGYRDFADFLDGFTADKRKKLKRERRSVSDTGLRLEARHGDEIDPGLWPAIHRHYRDTFVRHGNHPAFSLDFFRRVGAALGRRLVVFLAWRDDQPAASSICYRDNDALYGRHWGTDIHCPGLHFELCYHQGIEYAIAHGLARFEPGAQGEHKLARGFEPVSTWCAFWIADPGMRDLLARHMRWEEGAMQDYQAEMAGHLPFKTA